MTPRKPMKFPIEICRKIAADMRRDVHAHHGVAIEELATILGDLLEAQARQAQHLQSPNPLANISDQNYYQGTK